MATQRKLFIFDMVGRRFIGDARGTTLEGVITSVVIEEGRVEIYVDKKKKPSLRFRADNASSSLSGKGNARVFIPAIDAEFTVYGVGSV